MSWRSRAIEGGTESLAAALQQRRTEDGRPIVGPPVPLRPEEYNKLTTGVRHCQVRVLDLSKPEDVAFYADILDRYYNREVFFPKPPVEAYDSELHNWRVLVRWGETCAEMPIEHLSHRTVRDNQDKQGG